MNIRLNCISVITCWFLLSSVFYMRGETPVCTTGAEHAIYSLLGAARDNSVSPGVAHDNPAFSSKSLLTVFAVLQCPFTAERTLANDDNRETTRLWIPLLEKTLSPYIPHPLTPDTMSGIIRQIRCETKLPTLCMIRDQLTHLPHGMSQSHNSKLISLCDQLGQTLVQQAVDDFKGSDGSAGVAGVHNVAFLLGSCPKQFYVYMHDHPADISAWLKRAQTSLFWGEPEDKVPLEAYRGELIRRLRVSLRSDDHREEKKQLLVALQDTRVRLID